MFSKKKSKDKLNGNYLGYHVVSSAPVKTRLDGLMASWTLCAYLPLRAMISAANDGIARFIFELTIVSWLDWSIHSSVQ